MSEERTGVDLETVLMSESDGVVEVAVAPQVGEAAVQREMDKLSGVEPVGVPREVPTQDTLLNESRQQTILLYSIRTYLFSIMFLLSIGITIVVVRIILSQ
jgi:hypothetical protein